MGAKNNDLNKKFPNLTKQIKKMNSNEKGTKMAVAFSPGTIKDPTFS